MLTSPRLVARDLALGVIVGVFSGLFGVGGGIILVPILVLLMHVAQKRAQSTSLVMVMLAGSIGGVTYALSGEVAWPQAALLMSGGVAGALLGTRIVQRTSDQRLQMTFSLLLFSVAVILLVHSSGEEALGRPPLTGALVPAFLLAGLAMGLLSALMGVGGGVILVPMLVTLFGFGQHAAAGTSLVVMVPLAALSATRLTKAGHTDWPMGLRLGAGAMLGAVVGATLSLSLRGSLLQFGFAGLLVVTAIQMFMKASSAARRDRRTRQAVREGAAQ